MLGSNEGLILPVTHYVVAKAPSCPHGECFPTLFIETNGESGGHAKANQWALQNRGLRAQNTIAADLRVLGRLHDYHLVGWLGEVIRTIDLGPVDKLDSQLLRDVIQDSFCGGYLGAVADGGCRVGIL